MKLSSVALYQFIQRSSVGLNINERIIIYNHDEISIVLVTLIVVCCTFDEEIMHVISGRVKPALLMLLVLDPHDNLKIIVTRR